MSATTQPQQQPAQSSAQPAARGEQTVQGWEGFKGLNTQASRYGIADDECAIMDGWFPVGNSHVRTVPDNGPAIYIQNQPTISISSFQTGNIGPNPYIIVFQSDGSIVAVNTITTAATQIAPPGTILSPGSGDVGMTQWGESYLIIVARQTNGYFIWDGAVFYQAGDNVPVPGGPGPINTIAVVAGGTGYAVGDTGFIFGGINDAQYQITSESGGVVTGAILSVAGTLYQSGVADTVRGGGHPGSGSGLTLDLTVLTSLMPSGVSGTWVETYQSHVWVINGPTVVFSAPASFTDFSTSNGGGAFTSNDSFLRVHWVSAVQTNGYLYLIGDSSISYVANPQTTGSPPTTTFSLQNIDPEVGTPWPDTVDVLGSNIIMANAWGAHVSYGGRAAKVSDDLDGIYNSVPNFGGQALSAAKAIIFGKRVWCLLLPVLDPYTGQIENELFIWTSKVWCSAQQTAKLIYVQHQEIDSVLTAWGTDGVGVYPLFNTPSTNVRKIIRSKFWAAPGGIFTAKGVNRVTGIAIVYSGFAPVLHICLDSENGSSCVDVTLPSPNMIWYQDNRLPPDPLAVVLPWFQDNAFTDVLQWSGNGNNTVVFPPQGGDSNWGVINGMTVTTFGADVALVALAMIPVVVQNRI